MKKNLALLALLALSTPYGYAMADGGEPTLPSDHRIRVLLYDESDVYTITTKYGYQTNIVFGRDEQIETISMGDRSLWQIIPSGNRLFIRPMDDGVITNMTILTNRRSYQFDLKSLSADDKDKPLYVARFQYPEIRKKPAKPDVEFIPAPEVKLSPPPAGFTPAPVTRPAVSIPNAALNYNYTYTGSDRLAPLKVYDDGRSTYFTYPTLGKDLPDVFVLTPGEPERRVTFYSKGNQLVIDEVAGEIVMRHQEGVITIYNEVLNPKQR